jgi:hypothetical protein
MLRNLFIGVFLLTLRPCLAQMIEANSRPYRFNIDKVLAIESTSEKKAFEIQPYRTQIRNAMEKEIWSWLDQRNNKLSDTAALEKEFLHQLEVIQPEIINRVGISGMASTTPSIFFIPEKLAFEMHFQGFEPFLVEVPINEIEGFKKNYLKFTFKDQKITFNEADQFVVLELIVYDPTKRISYPYKSSLSDSITSPSFTISMPQLDW